MNEISLKTEPQKSRQPADPHPSRPYGRATFPQGEGKAPAAQGPIDHTPAAPHPPFGHPLPGEGFYPITPNFSTAQNIQKDRPTIVERSYVGITYRPGQANVLSCRLDSPVDCQRQRKTAPQT